jgi:hypothetical protein
MKSESVFHDHAFALAVILLELIENCIRPEEKRIAFEAFYEAAKAAFRSYEEQADRMHRRVQGRPSDN